MVDNYLFMLNEKRLVENPSFGANDRNINKVRNEEPTEEVNKDDWYKTEIGYYNISNVDEIILNKLRRVSKTFSVGTQLH